MGKARQAENYVFKLNLQATHEIQKEKRIRNGINLFL